VGLFLVAIECFGRK